MTRIDSYGEFELPEEKTEIEVMEDPVKTVLSLFDLFHTKFMKRSCWNLEEIYVECEKTFEGKEKLKIEFKDMNEILKGIEQKQYVKCSDVSIGLFLSAMHNSTATDVLFLEKGVWHYSGYKLTQNKTLITGFGFKKEIFSYAGEEGKGNIINYGYLHNLGERDKNSLTINLGETARQGNYSENGLHINQKTTQMFGNYAKAGVFINTETVKIVEKDVCDKVIKINANAKSPFLENAINLYQHSGTEKIAVLRTDLDSKLEQIDFLRKIKELGCEKIIKQTRKFDWKKFKQEITAKAEEIKEYYDGLK